MLVPWRVMIPVPTNTQKRNERHPASVGRSSGRSGTGLLLCLVPGFIGNYGTHSNAKCR